MSFGRGANRGVSTRGGSFGHQGGGASFGGRTAAPATAENDDWRGDAPAPAKKADVPQENGGSFGHRRFGFQENGSQNGGFQQGTGGQDFGDQQKPNGFHNGGGFGGGGFKSNHATNAEAKSVATGGNSANFQSGRGMAFGANRAGFAGHGGSASNNGDSNEDPAPARSTFGSRGGFGDRGRGESSESRPAFGRNRSEDNNEPGGFQRGGFGHGNARASGGRFGEVDNSATTEKSDSDGGSLGRGSSTFGHGGSFGSRFAAENGQAGGGRYANINNCHNCNKPGHMSRECSEPRAPRQGLGGGGERGDMKCFNCQSSGHISKDCPEEQKGRSNGNRTPISCYNCGQIGHQSRECTQPRIGGAFSGGNPGFSGTSNAFADSTYYDNKPSHVPVMRTIDSIFEEDQQAAEKYLEIRIEDDDVTCSGQAGEAPAMIEKWEEANFHESLLANITRSNYILPRKIQSYTIPVIMDGHDVKGHAETGSGKTAAFLLPIIDTIIKKKAAEEMKSERSKPIALIIEPTRELAVQLHDQARKLAENTGVSVAVAYGKYRYKENLRVISQGCDILVGTPGRLKDFILKRYVIVENLKYLVIDEADELLEDEFLRDIRDIASVDKFPKKEDRQTLMFSATFPEEVQKWADEWMRDKNVMVSNKKPASANNKVVQIFHLVSECEKKSKLVELLNEELAELKKADPENGNVKLRKTMIFVKLKRTCDVLCAYLQQSNFKSTTINGDRPQNLREKCLEELRTDKVQVVVTTDVCARGIDIKDLDHVINMDLPEKNYIAYVHRIGRTGRLKEGTSTSFFDPLTDMEMAKDLVKGIQEADQEVPEFLQKAADGVLKYETPKADEDEIWNANTVAVYTGFGASFGKSVGQNATSASPVADNDDWDE